MPHIIHIDRMRLKRAQRLEYETENSDRQGNDPNDEPVSTNDSRSNDSGEERNHKDVIIDMEGVDRDWEPESTQRRRRPPLWMSDYITRF